jgi:hypothetical protein
MARTAKVELAAAHARQVSPCTDLALVQEDLADLTPGLFADVDFVVLGLDNFRARLLATRLLLAARVPHIDAAASADFWQARVSTCDPAGLAEAGACLVCPWSGDQLARAGEDLGLPCVGPELAEAFASTLVLGHRAATLAVREVLAYAGVVALEPSRGRELRDDLARLRTESCAVHARDDCAADHVLAHATRTRLNDDPFELGLQELALACGLRPDDSVVLAGGQLVATAACTGCAAVTWPHTRSDRELRGCSDCGAARVAVRRTRRVRWGDVAGEVSGQSADAWFEPGDAFAIDAADPSRSRVVSFPPRPLGWRRGRPWRPADLARFERLPAAWDLERVRATRLGLVGLGHVGAAVLHELAPLGWGGLLLVDRDQIEPRNLVSHALAATTGLEELR